MRAKLDAIETLNRLQQLQTDERQIRLLSKALVVSLNIQPGTALVMLLGNGTERNNDEAVATWTRATLAQERLLPSSHALATLQPLLKAELTSLTAVE